nr:hypothetical protein [Tanacetum cinerariifolium]
GNAEEHGNADTTVEESKTAIPEDAANDQPIPSPTPLTPPPQQPQDVPSTSHAQSPSLQPHSPTLAQTQGAHFPMSLLHEALDACAALARRVEHLEQDKADIYNIDMDHAAKVLKVVSAVSETVSAADVIPSVVPKTISDAAVVPTIIAPPVKVAAPVKAVVPSTRRKRGVVIW